MGLDVAEMGVGTDLSLDLKMFAAKSVGRVRDTPASAMNDCIRRLEEEKGKIEMFRRELPLCARLLADVIDVMREEAEKKKVDREEEDDGGAGDKSKWMSTAQLWTGNSGRDAADSENQENERSSSEAKSHGGGAFVPFKGVGSGEPAFAPPCFRKDDKAYDVGMPDLSLLSPAPIKSSSTVGAAAESHRQVVGFAQAAEKAAAMASSGPSLALQPQSQQQQQQARKARRCWSPELHRLFVSALQQLGGPQVGTPKQIRELMKVDGLTNDEVKSHLQKYRLHNRREPNSAVVSQPVLLVNAAGLWTPPEQSSSQSGSPQGPLHFSTSGIAVSSAATVSCEEEDGRSESYGWK